MMIVQLSSVLLNHRRPAAVMKTIVFLRLYAEIIADSKNRVSEENPEHEFKHRFAEVDNDGHSCNLY
jgi:hypothetical protein